MNEKVIGVIVVSLGVAYAVFVNVYAKSVVRDWAIANGFRVVKWGNQALPPHGQRPNVMAQMEMLTTTSRNQVLRRVAFYDLSKHRTRTAWVRIGGFWFGMLNKDAVDVIWDDGANDDPS